jgi:hypothetical protein
MKTLTVDQAQPDLKKLVEEVHAGSPVILVLNEKLVKIERYVPFDPEEDSPELEAMLLEAVRGPHSPYSSEEMQEIVRKACDSARAK